MLHRAGNLARAERGRTVRGWPAGGGAAGGGAAGGGAAHGALLFGPCGVACSVRGCSAARSGQPRTG
ncbi:hypothetical protein DEJ04_12630 [Curtobacterium sp. MCLR17_044]|nr:hypothetical protein DEJ04_12630 [Curtobacterium sp. MCLR17_044]